MAVLIFAPTNASTAQAPPESVSTEDYRALREARYPIARTVALADPRVQEVLSTAVLNQTDLELRDNQDMAIINTWGKTRVEGSWQNGYLISYADGKRVEVLVDRKTNSIVSVNITPREDKVSNWSFSDNQKKLISILVNDTRFQNDFAGKSDASDYYMAVVRNTAADDPNSTGFIVIGSPT
ncbi:MAG: hypothetical protein ACRD98_09220, partial [Nitrososphaera sp.]